jgi:hypothetical protein
MTMGKSRNDDKREGHCEEPKATRQSGVIAYSDTRLLHFVRNDDEKIAMTIE